MNRIFAIIVSLLLVGVAEAQQQWPIIVHEWGTFTSLQDETGKTIDGINSDDEPVPSFVHSMLPGNIIPQSQGYRAGDPTVTMRLETPVLYVYAGLAASTLPKLDVKVEFHGGLLTQFYPKAETKIEALYPGSRGRLAWSDLTLGGNRPGPETSEHVWTAPRRPKSLAITTPAGESESYLFYRGVGCLDAPIKVLRTGDDFRINGRMSGVDGKFAKLWLCEFRPDGQIAWRVLNGLDATGSIITPVEFSSGEFATTNLDTLRKDMHAALIADGLYPDEATAMLDTWELSYFKSWGTRLFYVVPRAWTDKILPIEITPTPTELKRTMIGRIDLVTPLHRTLLKQMAGATDIKTQLPQLLNAYEQLGRFRYALVQDELKARPSSTVQQFMTAHGMQRFGKGIRPATRPTSENVQLQR